MTFPSSLLPLKSFCREPAGLIVRSLHLKGTLCKTVFRTLIFITPQGKMESWAIYIKLRISAYPVSALPLKENRGRTASFLEILGSS